MLTILPWLHLGGSTFSFVVNIYQGSRKVQFVFAFTVVVIEIK